MTSHVRASESTAKPVTHTQKNSRHGRGGKVTTTCDVAAPCTPAEHVLLRRNMFFGPLAERWAQLSTALEFVNSSVDFAPSWDRGGKSGAIQGKIRKISRWPGEPATSGAQATRLGSATSASVRTGGHPSATRGPAAAGRLSPSRVRAMRCTGATSCAMYYILWKGSHPSELSCVMR